MPHSKKDSSKDLVMQTRILVHQTTTEQSSTSPVGSLAPVRAAEERRPVVASERVRPSVAAAKPDTIGD